MIASILLIAGYSDHERPSGRWLGLKELDLKELEPPQGDADTYEQIL
jgi:hypothetical protein